MRPISQNHQSTKLHHVSNLQVHAHDRKLAWAPELWAAHQSYIRTRDALKREDPPLPMPRLTYTSAETHFDVCFKPLLPLFFPSEDDRLPSFTLSFALYSEAGRKDTVGRGHSVLKIKQVNFPSDRCSGGQGEEESTPQDTEMSSWQCNHTHTHTHRKQQSHIAQ